MNKYSDWNTALVRYFTQNVPYGTKIYLSLDDDTLEKIGSSFTQECDHVSWIAIFCEVVKNKVLRGDKINLEPVSELDDDTGYPMGIAFLGLMVLAANQ
ncbi:MAG: hypothetical protein ACKO4R_06170, partial [Synechococcales cyanobacterium]